MGLHFGILVTAGYCHTPVFNILYTFCLTDVDQCFSASKIFLFTSSLSFNKVPLNRPQFELIVYRAHFLELVCLKWVIALNSVIIY